ncbi:Cell division control protein 14 [Taphrina deformans PYCC 5710]|uniref:Cell division control protein 14 n=1 Tax=Taphrina deformans (strain PYCC 5710 / ATCC 11124 / CBS 356.35 / IMI 108563 / JCM 9778 / NBRC 8474) TaxID=1097556 RepID=R4X9R7_TAPDE|nr:Cell division control protein 14 [Taphrina deformans PYCC 5710]|eukprot:CCG82207.1 Cell division control protein 14 [Taphrina deformans PYCC 5710]
MSDSESDHDETLLQALDHLASSTIFKKSQWRATRAALKTIEHELSLISLGTAARTKADEIVAFPTEQNQFFVSFLAAQDRIQSNLASQLLTLLRRLVEHLSSEVSEEEQEELAAWLCDALYLLQGALLLHEPSRSLFSRSANMAFLVEFLACEYTKEIHMDAIQALVSALVDRPGNLRTFEQVGGLRSISDLFLHGQTAHQVKVKLLEFLYFYLIPEIPEESDGGREAEDEGIVRARNTNGTVQSTVRVRQHSREPAEDSRARVVGGGSSVRKTTEEKQRMLGHYFSNIDALVRDLNEFKPFGEY